MPTVCPAVIPEEAAERWILKRPPPVAEIPAARATDG